MVFSMNCLEAYQVCIHLHWITCEDCGGFNRKERIGTVEEHTVYKSDGENEKKVTSYEEAVVD